MTRRASGEQTQRVKDNNSMQHNLCCMANKQKNNVMLPISDEKSKAK